VLCDETAFFGVVKQKSKVSGEKMPSAVESGSSAMPIIVSSISMPASKELKHVKNREKEKTDEIAAVEKKI